MTLDHLGIAADDAATALFSRLLGAAPYKTETVHSQGVRTVFFGDGGTAGAAPKVELLESVTEGSPVARFLAARGPGLHHVAFQVADIEAEMARVRALGIRLLSEAPQPGADGKRIVFLHPKDTAGVLVELCADGPPAKRLLEIPWKGGTLGGYEVGAPDAPPLLALHGAMGTGAQMDRFTPVWARRFRVIALDLPGHGASPDEAEMSWGRFAEGVAAALDHLALDRPAVFGYSLGAAVALALARQRPLGRLALHATHVQWTAREVERMTAGLGTDAPEAEARMEALHGGRWREAVGRMERFCRGLPDAWISDDELGRVTSPALVSVGDRDGLFTPESAVGLWRALPGADLWVIPGATHALGSLEMEAFARRVADFCLQ